MMVVVVTLFCCSWISSCTYLSHLPLSLGCFMFCLVKVISGSSQDHLSSLWLCYYYSFKYLDRVANAGAERRKLKTKTTKWKQGVALAAWDVLKTSLRGLALAADFPWLWEQPGIAPAACWVLLGLLSNALTRNWGGLVMCSSLPMTCSHLLLAPASSLGAGGSRVCIS